MNYRCIGRDNLKWDIFDDFQPVCKFIESLLPITAQRIKGKYLIRIFRLGFLLFCLDLHLPSLKSKL